ncbi:polysaccharide deacetylase family protein [Mesorhizobium sp. AR10]|uniref:polysaccharide deacetylase family protein n=1 Tax=Mesorhizobium sp. AR10 TaxID=2865839 RepID=UPI00216070F6|nr:polysaccharide deacetylase family protein [Mesorhizobium sp. AR10]UVK41222.1 polysaccharide deacetylase family protein [Mesorhizobium sp. AR10]
MSGAVTARQTVSKLLQGARLLAGFNRPMVLMYHRVGAPPVDPWELAVSPQNFARQIEVLTKARDIVPMQWLAQRLREGRPPRNAVAITFDDGYADVLQNGVPILRRMNCPATVFVTTHAITDPSVFWWDILSRIILETPALPNALEIEIAGRNYDWRVGKDAMQADSNNAINRTKLHFDLHALLKPLRAHEREKALERLARWAGTDASPRGSDRAMTHSELRQLADIDGISIGAHTRTHPSLPLLKRDDLKREISGSRQECEEITGRRVVGFAYPFGDFNGSTANAVRSAGMDYAVTALPREAEPRVDPFRLPRVTVADWDEADFRRMVLCHG